MADSASLSQFVDLSAVLTGFTADVLNPPLDPLEIAQNYLNFVESNSVPGMLDELLATFESIVSASGGDPQKVADGVQSQILSVAPVPPATESIGTLARRIIRMWYLATWYTTEPPDPAGDGQVISANAYTRGLAWSAFQAHPMGYSEMTFGYWATPPAPPTATLVQPTIPSINTQ
jgi:hypothetical protein